MKNSKTYSKTAGILLLLITSLLLCLASQAQSTNNKSTLALLSIDVKGISIDAITVRNMVQLEVEKSNVFNVIDKYDIDYIFSKEGKEYSTCFGKTCLVELGKILKVDKMLTGSIDYFGEKIVVSFRIIDVKLELIEKVESIEFLNLESEMQKMIRITLNNLFNIKNDENIVNQLIDYNTPIAAPTTSLKLNGPRMGASYTIGDVAERLQASSKIGGYEMFPLMSQFGYQFETQYLSSGTFQALIEFILMVGGLESGKFIPSLSVLNGFRISDNGWEFAFGPSFKFVQIAEGYYDSNEQWHLDHEWDYVNNGENPFEIQKLPDNRGYINLSTNLLLAIGRTFKSGYLNIPVNVYVVPNKKGTVVGTSIGFNITKKR